MSSVRMTDREMLCFCCAVAPRHVICTNCRSIDCHPNVPSERSADADLGCSTVKACNLGLAKLGSSILSYCFNAVDLFFFRYVTKKGFDI
jgi:hypothetical protein